MTKRINHVAPLQLGIVLAILYAAISLIVVPFLILASVLGRSGPGLSIIFLLFIPVLYAVMGFIGGVIAAAIYNLIAKWTGGIELTFVDPPQKIGS